MKKLVLIIGLGLSMLTACGGPPSKEDVCGSCTGAGKTLCETAYDTCDGDDDCIEELEENRDAICALGGALGGQ